MQDLEELGLTEEDDAATPSEPENDYQQMMFDLNGIRNDLHDNIGVKVFQLPNNIRTYALNNRNWYLSGQQEFILKTPYSAKHPYVLGGFGALGNPSSFHHPYVRKLRCLIHAHMYPILKGIYPDFNVEMLIDRYCIRRKKGTDVTPETYHRDVTPVNFMYKENGISQDIIYGGWINLDEQLQYLSATRGTHLKNYADIANLEREGFAKLNKPQQNAIKANRQGVQYPIPPFHLIIFNQTLIHEVLKKKYDYNSHRMYIGWRITKDFNPLFGHGYFDRMIDRQEVIRLPSHQWPRMFSTNHFTFRAEYLNPFCDNIHY